MLRNICLAILISLSPALAWSQSNSLFLELGGSGGLGSVNYERLHLSRGDSGQEGSCTTFRTGFGCSPVDPNNGWVMVVPVMYNFLLRMKSFQCEVGAGLAPSITTKGAWYIKSPLFMGFRYAPVDSRLFFRAGYTPIFGWLLDRQWQHWAGISIGYKLLK